MNNVTKEKEALDNRKIINVEDRCRVVVYNLVFRGKV